ncbi:MAG: branched-chain amino acid ABC transporter permease [Desulfuromonadales bacterium]
MRNKIIGWSILAVIALGVVPLFVSDTFVLRILTEAIMWIGLAIAFDVLAGYTGYLNFGHGAFFGIGAYSTAILMVQANWPFVMALLAGALITALCALAAGFPTLRLRGAYFAIATWALSLAIQQLALILTITGGPDGMRLPSLLNPLYFFYIMLGVVAATFFLFWFLLEHAPFGLKLKAIREDELGAQSLGLNPTRLKIQAFVLSAVPTGILGGIYAYWITFIDPASTLSDLVSDQALVMVVFGGMGTLIGPVIGAVLIFAFKTVFWAYLSDFQLLYLIILGAVIALCVVFLPNGLWGTIINRNGGNGGLKKSRRVGPKRNQKSADKTQKLAGTLKDCAQKEGGE